MAAVAPIVRSAAADAALLLRQVVEEDPELVEGWLRLGIALAADGDSDGALLAYEQVVTLDPDHAAGHHNLGNVRFRQGDFERAIVDYARALELKADYQLAAFHLGWTLRQVGRSEEAEAAFRSCLEIPPTGPRSMNTRVDCMFGLGSLRHRAGDFEASARMMEQVLSVHRTHPEARYYLGMAYRQLGRVDEAKQHLEFHRQMMRAKRAQSPR
jgi:Flp pilus assembly protein TadD